MPEPEVAGITHVDRNRVTGTDRPWKLRVVAEPLPGQWSGHFGELDRLVRHVAEGVGHADREEAVVAGSQLEGSFRGIDDQAALNHVHGLLERVDVTVGVAAGIEACGAKAHLDSPAGLVDDRRRRVSRVAPREF